MADNTFDSWLCVKIRSLQLDEDVFLDYLKGVLEEETSPEEKIETIENILQGATVCFCHTAAFSLHTNEFTRQPIPSTELLLLQIDCFFHARRRLKKISYNA